MDKASYFIFKVFVAMCQNLKIFYGRMFTCIAGRCVKK